MFNPTEISEIQKLLTINENRVLSDEISSFIAANELLDRYFNQLINNTKP